MRLLLSIAFFLSISTAAITRLLSSGISVFAYPVPPSRPPQPLTLRDGNMIREALGYTPLYGEAMLRLRPDNPLWDAIFGDPKGDIWDIVTGNVHLVVNILGNAELLYGTHPGNSINHTLQSFKEFLDFAFSGTTLGRPAVTIGENTIPVPPFFGNHFDMFENDFAYIGYNTSD
ncbi:hypothetical protein K469DRAFT_697197 [Zopfia rhizophila CBS 207.26]|uniref:Uncharacterized protein n=1 Tax=Zopfia rhizophila CBS 207.26 TaxID=1314779 RepID=A0A6A6EIM9_9PEZI|nr:hypothetical protein K469DRAFT_697197 [Zopfia rhizophila CBS 207.26]